MVCECVDCRTQWRETIDYESSSAVFVPKPDKFYHLQIKLMIDRIPLNRLLVNRLWAWAFPEKVAF